MIHKEYLFLLFLIFISILILSVCVYFKNININLNNGTTRNGQINDTVGIVQNGDTTGTVQDRETVIRNKINRVILNPNVYTQYVYIYIDNPLDATARTGDNDVNIDASAIIPLENEIGDKADIYMTVNNPDKFECLLNKDNILFTKTKGIVIAGINPLPGGFNTIIRQINNDVKISLIDELGNLIIVPHEQDMLCYYIDQIENLF